VHIPAAPVPVRRGGAGPVSFEPSGRRDCPQQPRNANRLGDPAAGTSRRVALPTAANRRLTTHNGRFSAASAWMSKVAAEPGATAPRRPLTGDPAWVRIFASPRRYPTRHGSRMASRRRTPECRRLGQWRWGTRRQGVNRSLSLTNRVHCRPACRPAPGAAAVRTKRSASSTMSVVQWSGIRKARGRRRCAS
jgi:hypothetical protein